VSLLACSWLSPPRPGFRRRFTLCAHTPPRASQMARPMTSRSGPSAARRLLQPTQPASTTAGPPEPRLRCNEHSQRALARVARSTPRRCFRAAVGPGSRARPKPRSSTAAPAPSTGGAASPAHRGPFGLPRAVAGRGRSRIRPRGRAPVEVSRARSRSTFVAGALLAATLSGGHERALSQPDPLGHLSS